MKQSDLSTLFEFFLREEIPTAIIETILSYIGPRSRREFTTSGSVFEYHRTSRQWITRATKCGIKFLTNSFGGLEISYGDQIILVSEILKKKNKWRVVVMIAKNIEEMLGKREKSEDRIFGIRFYKTELVADQCTIVFYKELSKVFYSASVILFSLRNNKLAILNGTKVLFVVDRVKKKSEREICMDIIYIDSLKEYPISIRFNTHARETFNMLEQLLKDTRFFGFGEGIGLRYY